MNKTVLNDACSNSDGPRLLIIHPTTPEIYVRGTAQNQVYDLTTRFSRRFNDDDDPHGAVKGNTVSWASPNVGNLSGLMDASHYFAPRYENIRVCASLFVCYKALPQ